MTLSELWPGFQGHDIFEVEYQKNDVLNPKLLLHNRKLYLGTVFGDLDWPTNTLQVCQHQLSFLLNLQMQLIL